MSEANTLFLDTEFTALRRDAELVSLALVAESGESFYAEIAGLDPDDCDPWVREHVLAHCEWLGRDAASAPVWTVEGGATSGFALADQVAVPLREWLAPWPRVEIWTDGGAWDWVLFCELFGGALSLPDNIFYLPFDLVTLLKLRGVDPDVDRLAFAVQTSLAKRPLRRHHALDDARVLMACYRQLMEIPE